MDTNLFQKLFIISFTNIISGEGDGGLSELQSVAEISNMLHIEFWLISDGEMKDLDIANWVGFLFEHFG